MTNLSINFFKGNTLAIVYLGRHTTYPRTLTDTQGRPFTPWDTILNG